MCLCKLLPDTRGMENTDATAADSGARGPDNGKKSPHLKMIEKVVPFFAEASLCSAFLNSNLIRIYSIKI